MDNYNLYFLKTKKFKTISLSIRFRKEKEKKDAVYACILKEVLKAGTKNYKKINEYYKARLNLYNPSIKIGISNYGKSRTFLINGKFTNEKYTEKGMNKKTLEFIFNILYNPKANKKQFDSELFDICKHNYIEALKAAKDDHFKYATDRLWEEMSVYDFKVLNNEEAITLAEKITAKDLYNYYLSLFEENSLDIFIVGDFDFQNTKNLINKIVKGNFKKSTKNKCINYTKKEKTKEIIEELKTNQSQMAIGLKFLNLTDFQRKYVSIFYTSILGGGWSSKLFQVVREQNSLCYYIGASRSISHSVFFINASIDAKDYRKALKLIKQQLASMAKGEFEEKDIKQVKQVYLNSLLEIKDNQTMFMNNLISDNDSIIDRQKNIEKINKKLIIDLANKVYIDTIYFLKGVDNDKAEN